MQVDRTHQSKSNDPAEFPLLSSLEPRGTLYVVTGDASVMTVVVHAAASLGLPVSAVSTLHELHQKYEHNRPSLLIFDSSLTTLRRDQLEREIKRLGGATSMIFLLDRPDTQATVRAVKAGAVAVLEKPLSEGSLREVVSQAMNESVAMYSKNKEANDFRRRLASLSSGQRAVLDLVLDGLANKSIARMLRISIRTVEMRRSRIYKCLNVDSVAHLVRRCVDANYIEP